MNIISKKWIVRRSYPNIHLHIMLGHSKKSASTLTDQETEIVSNDWPLFATLFMTVSWLPIFMSPEPSWTMLSIDRSEPSFEHHTRGKIRKTLKTMEIFMFFVNFQQYYIRNCFVQIKKMKDEIFSFQMKNYFFQKLTGNARHKNVPPSTDGTKILKSFHKRMIEEK